MSNELCYTPMEKRVVDLIKAIPNVRERNLVTLDQVVELYYTKREKPMKPRNTIATVLRTISYKSNMLGPPFILRASKLGVNSKKEGRKAEYRVTFVK